MNLFNNEIKFMHFRNMIDGKPSSRGGTTVAYFERDGLYTWAYALCSRKDNYSRHEGRAWAVKRLRNPKNVWFFKSREEFRETLERCIKDQFGYERQYGKRKASRSVPKLNVPVMSKETEGLTAN
jgi:hypothetical protein